jgi:hypothetical protein
MRSATLDGSRFQPNGRVPTEVVLPRNDSLELLSVAEVAKLVHQSANWVRSQCRARAKDRMPHIKRGRRLFFEEAAVLAWFRRGEIAYPKPKR